MANSQAQINGRRMLREIEADSGNLDELLHSLRTTLNPSPTLTGLPLDSHLTTHSSRPARLHLSGPQSIPLLYSIIPTTLRNPQNLVLLIDVTGRLSTPFLSSLSADAQSRLYVCTAGQRGGDVSGQVEAVQQRLLASVMGEQGGNAGRVLAYTVVMGVGAATPPRAATARCTTTTTTATSSTAENASVGLAGGSRLRTGAFAELCGEIIVSGRRSTGVRVEKGWVSRFGAGISVDEAVGKRERRGEGVRDAGFVGNADDSGNWRRIEGV